MQGSGVIVAVYSKNNSLFRHFFFFYENVVLVMKFDYTPSASFENSVIYDCRVFLFFSRFFIIFYFTVLLFFYSSTHLYIYRNPFTQTF